MSQQLKAFKINSTVLIDFICAYGSSQKYLEQSLIYVKVFAKKGILRNIDRCVVKLDW